MKIHILSDLHLEFKPFNTPEINADLVVLAGDIDLRERGIKWAIQNIPNKPVIYVWFFSTCYAKLLAKKLNK